MTDNRSEAGYLLSNTADKTTAAAPRELPPVSVDEAFASSRRILEQRLNRAPAPVRPYSSYLSSSHGKNIRAWSLILVASRDGESVNPDAAVFAAAIELLHLATLVHDDVMDEADYRRGDLTLQRKAGARVAVITGDYLLADVLSLTAETAEKGNYRELARPSFLTQYMVRIAMGELRQTIQNGNFSLGISEYLRIIAGKTAALFEASFFAGSLLATSDRREQALYKKIGRSVGMIFQLTDDCMDYESTLPDAGKNVQSDYEQQVVTLPLIYAFAEDRELRDAVEKGRADSATVYEKVRETSSIRRTRRLAMKYRQKAEDSIRQLNCSETKKQKLNEIVALSYREFS